MVDSVEEILVHDIHQVRNLEHEKPVVSQHFANTACDVCQIVGVGENIIGADNRGPAVSLAYRGRQLRAEKLRQGFNSGLSCFSRNLASGIYAEYSQTPGLKEFEKRTVVAADLYDQRIRSHFVTGQDIHCVLPKMLDQSVRTGRVVDIVAKQHFRIDYIQVLHMTAVPAEVEV